MALNYTPISKYGFTPKPTGGWALPSGGTFKDGWYYFGKPKADGGLDYYKANNTDIISMAPKDWENEQGNISAIGGQNQPKTQFTPGYATDGDGSSDISAINDALAKLEQQRKDLTPQFEQQYAKYLSDLQGQYDTAAQTANRQYGQNTDQADTALGQGLMGVMQGYGAGGLQDSSFYNNARQNLWGGFGKTMNDINYDKSNYFKNIDAQMQAGKESAGRAKNNFYNPTNQQYGSMDEVMSAQNSILGAYDELQNKKASVSSNSTYNPAAWQMQVLDVIDKLAGTKGNLNQKQQMLQGYLGNLDSKSKGYYQDWLELNDIYNNEKNRKYLDEAAQRFADKYGMSDPSQLLPERGF